MNERYATKEQVDALLDLLPNDPRDALSVAALLLASVSCATRCPDDDTVRALRVALKQMHTDPVFSP